MPADDPCRYYASLDAAWRDLSVRVYAGVGPMALGEFRKLFYAGATTATAMIHRDFRVSVTRSDLEQRLDRLTDELERFRSGLDPDQGLPLGEALDRS